MQKNESIVRTNTPHSTDMPRLKITAADIQEVKTRLIERNLLFSPEEAGQVLGKSSRTILDLVRDGKLIAANESAARGGKISNGIRITAESLEAYRLSIIVPPEVWKK
jgi:hypothetical protein